MRYSVKDPMEIEVPNCGLNAKALLLAAKIYNREYSPLVAMLSNPPDQFSFLSSIDVRYSVKDPMEIKVPNCGWNAKALLLAAKIYNREYITLNSMLSNLSDHFSSLSYKVHVF